MKPKTILLFYEKNHLKHPFIKLLYGSLRETCPDARILIASFAPKDRVPAELADRFIALGKWRRSKVANTVAVKRAYGASKLSIRLLVSAQDIFGKFKPDVIISFLPGGFAAAQLWAHRRVCRTIYYPFELYGKQRSKYSTAVVLLEMLSFLSKPDAVITQNEHRAQFYVDKRGCQTKPVIAHNYKLKPKADCAPIDFHIQHGIPRHKRIVLYQGMLSEGRWLDRLVLSAKYLPDDAVLVLMGPKQPKWWAKNIEPMLADKSLSSKLVVLEQVDHEMVFSYALAASVGVVIYDDSVLNNVYCEPGKICDFVHAGVPVIAPGFPSIKPVIEDGNLGVTFTDFSPRGIGDAISAVLAYPEEYFSASLRAAAKYMTWEAQWPALSRCILGQG